MGDPLVFNYSGTCTDYCETVGLDLGDSVTGWVEFEHDGGLTLNTNEMLSFSFTLGNLVFTESTTDVFSLVVKLLEDQVASFDFRMSNSLSHLYLKPTALLNSDGMSGVTPSGYCNATCDGHWMNNDADISDGAIAWANPHSHTASVPEPGTFALMGMALLGLAFRRKHVSEWQSA